MGLAKRQRNQKGEGSRLKGELMEAAMRILDRTPGVQLSLRMIAREAGVAAPSVYPHFADARSLMTAIVRECWRQVGEEMACAAGRSASADGLGQLQGQMSAFVSYAMERPSRYQLLFALYPIDPEEEDRMQGHLRPAYRQVLEAIERFVAEGGQLPAEDEGAAALLAISIAHGRIALARLAPNRPGNSAGKVEAFVTDSLRRIFLTKKARAQAESGP